MSQHFKCPPLSTLTIDQGDILQLSLLGRKNMIATRFISFRYLSVEHSTEMRIHPFPKGNNFKWKKLSFPCSILTPFALLSMITLSRTSIFTWTSLVPQLVRIWVGAPHILQALAIVGWVKSKINVSLGRVRMLSSTWFPTKALVYYFQG